MEENTELKKNIEKVLYGRKISFTNSMRAVYNKHDGLWKSGNWPNDEIMFKAGYELALRRIEKALRSESK